MRQRDQDVDMLQLRRWRSARSRSPLTSARRRSGAKRQRRDRHPLGRNGVLVAIATRTVRPRTRIRVAPIYPYRTFSTDYPVPYEYEYPGPRGVRQCTSRLVQENRPSGPIIVPTMHCWWEVR